MTISTTEPSPSVNKQISEISYSQRELQIIHWIIRGKTMREIASILGLSCRTVENYFQAVKAKAGVKSKSKFIEIAMPHFFNNAFY
jgi:DNA-binding CsgD family transcriptional regulator